MNLNIGRFHQHLFGESCPGGDIRIDGYGFAQGMTNEGDVSWTYKLSKRRFCSQLPFISSPSKCLNFLLVSGCFAMNLSAFPLAAALQEAGGCRWRQGGGGSYAKRILLVETKHDPWSQSQVTQPSHRESINWLIRCVSSTERHFLVPFVRLIYNSIQVGTVFLNNKLSYVPL